MPKTAVNNSPVNALADFAGYLICRWQDEKEYEDPKEYRVAFEKRVKELFGPEAKLVSFKLSPFHAVVEQANGGERLEFKE